MSLAIYLDDCANDHELARQLRAAGHQVTRPVDVGMDGRDDADHFEFTLSHGALLLTKDPDDFKPLVLACPDHPGILAVYQDNDRHRDMTYADVVRSIANLEAAGVPIAGQFHVLNQWRY